VIYSLSQEYLWRYAKYAIKKCSQQIVASRIKSASLMVWKLYGLNIISRNSLLDATIAMSN
jgi:hypothetical protein